MIYEYPEKFVVPVVYVDDLKEKTMHRDWEIKYLQVESMVKPDKNMEDDNIFTINEYDNETFYEGINGKKEITYLEFDDKLLKKTYQKNMFSENEIQENLDNDNMSSILNDIDEDYANNETLSM